MSSCALVLVHEVDQPEWPCSLALLDLHGDVQIAILSSFK